MGFQKFGDNEDLKVVRGKEAAVLNEHRERLGKSLADLSDEEREELHEKLREVSEEDDDDTV